MTDIQALKDRVVEAAKKWFAPIGGIPNQVTLVQALRDLAAAEEAAKRPRLRPHYALVRDVAWGSAKDFGEADLIAKVLGGVLKARDAEWLAALRSAMEKQGNVYSVLWEDIEALAESAKR